MTVVKINRLAVPEGQEAELEKRFAARKHSVDHGLERRGDPGVRGRGPGLRSTPRPGTGRTDIKGA